MRVLAISRFRLLTTVRAATPMFVASVLPPFVATLVVSGPEPRFRDTADFWMPIHASAALLAWVLHATFLACATLMSGKVRTAHDFVSTEGTSDLMDTAPVAAGPRFLGEVLGTLQTAALIHLCCLPLLVTVAVLSPLPTAMFLWVEAAAVALLVEAAAGAAWQRRMPRTKYSATRGPRNALLLVVLAGLVFAVTTRPLRFRDSILDFLLGRKPSARGWAEVMATVENPTLLAILLALTYAGSLVYYYVSATRKPVREN